MTSLDFFEDIAGFVFGSAGLGAAAASLLYVTKEAIAKAVTQAGAIELERLRAQLSTKLEKERQAFTLDLEREKHQAAQALERFKGELSLAAELRRQVATARVAAVASIITKSDDLLSCFAAMAGGDGGEEAARRADKAGAEFGPLLEQFTTAVRQTSHVFPTEAAAGFARCTRAIRDSISRAFSSGGSAPDFAAELPILIDACARAERVRAHAIGRAPADRHEQR